MTGLPPQQEDEAVCDVCAHAMAGHDATALRYCRATRAHATTRGCICRVQ